MAENQNNAEPDDGKQLVVENLPESCDQDVLLNFFESRRQFGGGITVEKIELDNNKAILTFENDSNVDQILQRHERDPCVLLSKELSITPVRCDVDAIDGGSCVAIRGSQSASSCSGFTQFPYSRSLDQYGSLMSINSVVTVDSSELFGSGCGRDNYFSKEYTELHLYLQNSVTEKRVVKLRDTDTMAVIVSYAATTCNAEKIKPNDQRRRNESANTDNMETLLTETLLTQLKGAVHIKTEASNIVVTLTENIQTVNTLDEFQEAVIAALKSLGGMIAVQLQELNTERSDLALKHFQPLVHKNPTIKIYKSEDDLSLYIAYQPKSDKALVDVHIAIIRDQPVIKHDKKLQLPDFYKIQAHKPMLDAQSAMLIVDEKRIVVEGFQEDVNSTMCAVNKVLLTTHCVTKQLEEFALDMVKEDEVVKEIQQILTKENLKSWWKVSGHFLNVVDKSGTKASKAAGLISKFFSTYKVVELPKYLLESERWKTLKTVTINSNQKRLTIDDDGPAVIIKGTTDACKTFAETIKEFENKNTRKTKTIQLTEAKCEFVFKHLQKEVENSTDAEFLHLSKGADKTQLTIVGTESARQKFDTKLKGLSTQKFWIGNEKAADRLKELSVDENIKLTGTVLVFENQTDVVFKNGRIEEEQVDVIVNSAAQDLNLGTGDYTITHSISNIAGAQAQKCLERYKRPVAGGVVIVGEPGNMKCKAIFHAVLEHFNGNDTQSSINNLKKVVTTCLDQATERGYTRIAIPVLGSGIHKYPIKTVGMTMLDSITAYCCQHETSPLKKIIIVFLNEDKDKRKAFDNLKKERQQSLKGLNDKKILWNAVPWPCRFYCHITAASTEAANELAQQVNAELMDQSYLLRLEQTE